MTTPVQEMYYTLSHKHDRKMLRNRFQDSIGHSGHTKLTCKYHNMRLCPELVQCQSVTSEVINTKIKAVRLQSSSQQNTTHYYFYNRLMDHWHNMAIVRRQRPSAEICICLQYMSQVWTYQSELFSSCLMNRHFKPLSAQPYTYNSQRNNYNCNKKICLSVGKTGLSTLPRPLHRGQKYSKYLSSEFAAHKLSLNPV